MDYKKQAGKSWRTRSVFISLKLVTQTGVTEDPLIHIISYSLKAPSFVGLFGMLSFSVKLHID